MASVTFPPALGGDGSTVTDDTNATTGLANGGHRARFVPSLGQAVAVMSGGVAAAQAKVDLAAAQVTLATNQANAAAASQSAAAASAASAVNAPGTSATSTSSLVVGTGSKSLTVQTGKAFVVGQPVMIADSANPSLNWMAGNITAYTSGTGALVVDVVWIRGSGTIASWVVSLSAPANPAAVSRAGDTMTGVLNWATTTTVASAATVDLSTTTNTVNVTGTATITSLGTVAAGAHRLVTFAGALTLTHNATSLVLPSGDNILTAAGDSAEFLSLGSGNWKCTAYLPAVGQIATQAEAQAGTATNRVMTPLRVVQAIQSQQNPLLNYTLGFV